MDAEAEGIFEREDGFQGRGGSVEVGRDGRAKRAGEADIGAELGSMFGDYFA